MKIRFLLIIFAVQLVSHFLSAQSVSVPKTYNKPVLMHYMPWFETPEFNQKWGSHWTMNNQNPDVIVDAATGKRQIASHFYPLIGPYSSIDPAVIEYHLLLMKYAGVDGVLIDWYGVQGSNGDINSLLTNSNALIDKTNAIGLDFAIILEDRFSRSIADVQQNMSYMKNNYFNKSNYFRYGPSNKPFLGVFGPISFEQESDWNAIMPFAGEDLIFLSLWNQSDELGMNGNGEYSWIFNDDNLNNYASLLDSFYRNKAPLLDTFMGVAYPGFKDFYEEGNVGTGFFTINHNNSNTLNQILQLNSQYQSDIDVLQLATWNDFGEGTMFEPTEEFGFSFLTTLQTYLGVSYGLEELQQIHRLYTLRKKYASSTNINLELDKALNHFLSLNPNSAKNTMDVVEGISLQKIEAENFDNMLGVQLENNNTTVGFFDNGDWLLFENLDFGTTTQSIIFNLAKGSTGGSFELRLDSLAGPLLATHYPENTGSWTEFKQHQIYISEVSGVHDLYIVAREAQGVCNFDWFSFSENKNIYFVNFGSEPITNPDINSNHWTNIETKSTTCNLTDIEGGQRYQIEATGNFLPNNNSDFINPDANILGNMAITEATKSYLFLSGTGTGTITISNLDTNRLYKLSVFGSRNTTNTRETRYTIKGSSTESGVLQTSGIGIATNSTLNTNDNEFYVVHAFSDTQGEIAIDVAIESGGFGYINMLKIEEVLNPTLTFDGSTDSDWATATNWNDDVVPTALYSAIIPASQNVTVDATTNAVTKDLTIDNAGSLIIENSGSLVASGKVTGNLTYNVGVSDTNWHLISSPVVGETYNDTWVTSNSIALGSENTSNRAIASYQNGTKNPVTGSWVYMQQGQSGTFTNGVGYSMLRSAGTNYGFTGRYKSDDLVMNIDSDVNNWNLVGNPFTSYIKASDVINANSVNLTDTHEFIYIYNGASYIPLSGSSYISPGQGFFVNAANSDANNFTITEAMQSHQTGVAFYKNNTPTIVLKLSDGKNSKETKLTYHADATTGLDIGKDAGTFSGVNSDINIYSHLVSNSEGVDFMIQALPDNNYENMIVPIGVKAKENSVLIFSAETTNLPESIRVYLEDKKLNIFKELDQSNTYQLTIDKVLNGVGRFYLHTSSGVLSTTDTLVKNNISIFKINNNALRIKGLPKDAYQLKVYNVLGKEVKKVSFTATVITDISLPKLVEGVYIVELKSNQLTLNKKIILE